MGSHHSKKTDEIKIERNFIVAAPVLICKIEKPKKGYATETDIEKEIELEEKQEKGEKSKIPMAIGNGEISGANFELSNLGDLSLVSDEGQQKIGKFNELATFSKHDQDNQLATVKVLKSQGKFFEPKLLKALEEADLELVRVLIHQGADLNVFYNTEKFTIETRNDQLGTYLKGACQVTPLQLIACNNHENSYEISNLILDNGGDMFAVTTLNKDSALHLAAFHGNVFVCRSLLEKGMNVNFPNGWGITPFMMAAMRGKVDVIPILFNSNKLEAFQKSPEGLTAKDFAVKNNNLKTVVVIEECLGQSFKKEKLEVVGDWVKIYDVKYVKGFLWFNRKDGRYSQIDPVQAN